MKVVFKIVGGVVILVLVYTFVKPVKNFVDKIIGKSEETPEKK